MPGDPPLAPRLPPNAIVLAERNPANPVTLGPGENVVTLRCDHDIGHYLAIDVVGENTRRGRTLWPRGDDLVWYYVGSCQNLTRLELGVTIYRDLMDGRTVSVDDDKTFVLSRFREYKAAKPTAPGKAL